MRDVLVARAYFFGWFIVRRISEKSARTLFNKIGSWMYRRNGKSVERLRSNLKRVCPEISQSELE